MADPTTLTMNTMPNVVGGPAGGFASIIDLIRGVQGRDLDEAGAAAAAADPFAQQRGEYMKQLAAFMKDPSSLRDQPGYQFALNEGLDSVAAKGNSMFGTTRSGNTAAALEKYGVGYADQAYNTHLSQLMQLAGVNAGSPAAAGALLSKGPANRNNTIAGALQGLLGNGGASLIQRFKGLFGNSGTGLNGATPDSSTLDLLRSLGIDTTKLNMSDIFNGEGGSASDLIKQILGGGTDTGGGANWMDQWLASFGGSQGGGTGALFSGGGGGVESILNGIFGNGSP